MARRHRRKLNRRLSASPLVSSIFFFFCSSHVYCYPGDTLKHGERLYPNRTLVSAGEKFALRSFTTMSNTTSPKIFVGICYNQWDRDTFVWVANREKPLPGNLTAVFGIAEDGNLKVWDTHRKEYWSTNLGNTSPPTNRTVKLMDSGNLVLSDDHMPASLWESFKNPTDTFLAGMKMDEKLTLTSWQDDEDPGSGLYTFKLDIQAREGYYVVSHKSLPYWKNRMPGKFSSSDQLPYVIANLLTNFSMSKKEKSRLQQKDNKNAVLTDRDFTLSRLLMKYDGQLQYLTWDVINLNWSLTWSEPEEICSIYNACGKFGSCNIYNWPLECKCLPGFKPANLEKWGTRDFSGGCTRNSTSCKNDTFLSLKMMKVSTPDSNLRVKNEKECENECLGRCECLAYSYQEAGNSKDQNADTTDSANYDCWIWSENLSNLQEEYPNQGHNLSVRVPKADIEQPTVRICEPCGTNIIPYPLSTGENCGDPMYFSLECETSSGQVRFNAPSGSYRVVNISSSTRKLVIQVENAENHDARNARGILALNVSLPFNLSILNPEYVGNSIYYLDEVEPGQKRKIIVAMAISWEPPKEPTCTSSTDCKNLPHSNCNATRDGKLRCLCHPNFRWDASSLSCTKEGDFREPLEEPSTSRKVPLPLIVMIPLACVFALACTIIYYMRRRKMAKRQEVIRRDKRDRALHLLDSGRHVKELIDSVKPIEDDGEGIEVPFFDLESILAATNNFSDGNKLGQGGYGPVYKGTFSGGHEIAVKRLLSVSGQGLKEFKNEVVLISKLQHRNLVRLRGYCIEGDEKILLYEYMPNKSLDLFIFDQNQSMVLDWKIRFNIILGIARGLLYLHQDSRLRVIHRDLKTSNILLDEEMNPKISDFGLARIVSGKETGDNTGRVAGTYGYMSPEYALDGLFSVKSDVYSFGVVMLEVISGKKNTGFYRSEQAMGLLAYAWRLWVENEVLDLMDQNLRESCDADQLVKCVNIAFLCLEEEPSDRPTISNIVTMLDSETVILPTPKQPAFILRRGIFGTATSSSQPETHTELIISEIGETQNA